VSSSTAANLMFLMTSASIDSRSCRLSPSVGLRPFKVAFFSVTAGNHPKFEIDNAKIVPRVESAGKHNRPHSPVFLSAPSRHSRYAAGITPFSIWTTNMYRSIDI
jgi:hypothetical protein